MQSCVWMSLASGSGGGGDGGGMCGCGGFGANRRAQQSAGASSSSSAPLVVSPASSSSSRRFPPPRYRSPAHVAAPNASSKVACVLSVKRLLLSRARAAAGPTPGTGEPADETEQRLPAPLQPDKAAAAAINDIDLHQFKSVRAVAGPASSTSLAKMYLDLHAAGEGGGGDSSSTAPAGSACCTYKLRFASARERDVWVEILDAYGSYREFDTGNTAGTADGAPPRHAAAASGSNGRVDESIAAGLAAAVPYYAYTIPSLYVRALQSCLDALVLHRAFEREGLFRTGRSSPLLMRQLLLNGGVLQGGRWGQKGVLAASPTARSAAVQGLDPHTVAFVAKSLLRSLPETLLTNALMLHILQAAGRNDAPLLIALLHHLPPSNSQLLQRLFELLLLTLRCPSSRMTCDSLTKVVGPNLLPRDDVDWIRSMTGASAARGSIDDNANANGDGRDATHRHTHTHSSVTLAGANAGAHASSSSSAGAASSTGGLAPPTPPPGSLPMLQLFTMVFEHGALIWPRSLIFAPGGVEHVLNPPAVETGHSGVVRVHGGAGGGANDTDGVHTEEFGWGADGNATGASYSSQHPSSGGGGGRDGAHGVGVAQSLSPVAEEALSALSRMSQVSPSQTVTTASFGGGARGTNMDTRSPTITATTMASQMQQRQATVIDSAVRVGTPVSADAAAAAAASFASIAASSAPVAAVTPPIGAAATSAAAGPSSGTARLSPALTPAAATAPAAPAASEMELVTAVSAASTPAAPSPALSIDPSLGAATGTITSTTSGSSGGIGGVIPARLPYPRSTTVTPTAVRFHSWRRVGSRSGSGSGFGSGDLASSSAVPVAAASAASAAAPAPAVSVPVVQARLRSISPPRRAVAQFEREQEREIVQYAFPFPRFHEEDE